MAAAIAAAAVVATSAAIPATSTDLTTGDHVRLAGRLVEHAAAWPGGAASTGSRWPPPGWRARRPGLTDRAQRVGRPRPRGGQRDAEPPRGPGVAVGGIGRGLLVAHAHEPDADPRRASQSARLCTPGSPTDVHSGALEQGDDRPGSAGHRAATYAPARERVPCVAQARRARRSRGSGHLPVNVRRLAFTLLVAGVAVQLWFALPGGANETLTNWL